MISSIFLKLTRIALFCQLFWIIPFALGTCIFHNSASYGPFDYKESLILHPLDRLNLVERAHFTPEVASLKSGKSGTLGGDIGYTLNAFPNHYRALDAMSRLAKREHTDKPVGSRCTVEEWFARAINFTPKDAKVREAYGIHLYRNDQYEKALEEFKLANTLLPNNSNIQYNLGLTYFALKRYDEANQYAQQAYQAYYPLPGLKNKLIKSGHWNKSILASSHSSEPQPTISQ